MFVRLAAVAAVFALAAPLSAGEKSPAQREREVRVALALADAPAKAVVAAPAAKATFDWLGDEPKSKACECCGTKTCTCTPEKSCGSPDCPTKCKAEAERKPAPAAPAKVVTYHYESRCYTDAFGRRFCQQVLVPDEAK